MKKKSIVLSMVLAVIIALSIITVNVSAEESSTDFGYRACEHTYSYQLDKTTYVKETDTTGGHRHYDCSECGASYEYDTAPLVYTENPKTGGVVNHAGASNPVLPMWEHTPDAEPHVFWSRDDNEWRVYTYGSNDRSAAGTSMCSKYQTAWSAPIYDMSDWRYEGEVFNIADSNKYNAMSLFAPDVDYDVTTDTYYMTANEVFRVVTLLAADNPAGKWSHDNEVWQIPNTRCFDPTIYIDDDGTIYVGGSVQRAAYSSGAYMDEAMVQATAEDGYTGKIKAIYKLKKDLSDGDGIEEISYCPNNLRPYLSIYEGTSLEGYVEELGKYVLTYVSYEIGTDGVWSNSSICYAYADDLMGNWTIGNNGVDDDIVGYEGTPVNGSRANFSGDRGNIISDTSGRFVRNLETGEMEFTGLRTHPAGNNHGGMAKINGKWYFFGHRQTNRNMGGRQSIAGQLKLYLDDNDLPVIEPMELTSSGVADSLDAFSVWNASSACYIVDQLGKHALFVETDRNTSTDPYISYTLDQDATHATPIVDINQDDVIGFKYLNFGEALTDIKLKMLVRQESGYVDGKVNVYIDAPSAALGGTMIGSLDITAAEIANAGNTETATNGMVWSWLEGMMDRQVTGVHGVYFVFGADSDGLICKFDQFGFSEKYHLNADFSVPVTATVTNNSTINIANSYVILTISNHNGVLMYATQKTVDVDANSSAKITFDVSLSDYPESDYTYKIFWWNSQFIPLVAAARK